MSGAKFELLFNQSQVNAVIAELAATPTQITKASNAAARHTLNVMSTLVARTLAQTSGIPSKALKTRMRVSRLSGTNPVWILWVGLNDMPYDVAGPVSQSRAGLVHGKGTVKGGFYKGVFDKTPYGWIRKKRARELKLDIAGIKKSENSIPLDASLSGRFPVMRISHDLGKHADEIIKGFEDKARARFLERFDHELRRLKGKK
ncbi:MAG: hypothetical protein ACRCXB_25105 [Aeromonadaceae bacterium]